MHIQNTSEIDSPWTHWFFYGPMGSGKTTLASTFPKPLFLVPASESSELTLAGRDIDYVHIGRDENGLAIPAKKHLDATLLTLVRRHNASLDFWAKGRGEEAEREFPWQTVVMESCSHYCSAIEGEIANGKQMDQQKWGQLAQHMAHIQSTLRGLQVHAVFIAHDKISGEGSNVIGGPDLPGKTATRLPSACDVVSYCEAISSGKDTTYRAHFRQHRVYPARSRFKTMPAYVDDFDFAEIRQSIPILAK